MEISYLFLQLVIVMGLVSTILVLAVTCGLLIFSCAILTALTTCTSIQSIPTFTTIIVTTVIVFVQFYIKGVSRKQKTKINGGTLCGFGPLVPPLKIKERIK